MKIKIKSIDRHRNGISGVPFYVVLFTQGLGKQKQNMMAIKFDDDSAAYTAILNTDMVASGNIRFGENSFRGDEYAKSFDGAIAEFWNRKACR